MRDYLLPTAKILETANTESVGQTALVTAIGFAAYGFTVGFWRSPEMGFYVAIKMPLLIALTLACNTALNGMLGLLMGSELGFTQSLLALLRAFAISGIVLGSVAPVTFFLALNFPSASSPQAAASHSAYLLTHVFLIGVAGLIGVFRLGKLLTSHCKTPWIARSTLGTWIVGNAFLGAQFSWILRPFFGSPGLKVAFLREHPMDGSFYEAVGKALLRITGNPPWESIAPFTLIFSITAFLILQLKHYKRNQRP
jgi:hypothetical protein